ncbi:MAG: VOC family protein [Candidatus Hodarchaeota archaeon]
MRYNLGIEIPVPDFEKGVKFYEAVFGWKFDREKYPDVGVYDLNGCIQIGIFQSEKVRPKGLNVGLGVEDIEATLKKINLEGGKTVKDKFTYAPGESVAVFQDCFGNELSLWQS